MISIDKVLKPPLQLCLQHLAGALARERGGIYQVKAARGSQARPNTHFNDCRIPGNGS